MADLSKSQQDTQKEKEMAGRAAAELVRDGDVVGLGTGSTAYFAVLALGERVKAGLKIVGIPTSNATAELAKKVGVPLTSIDQHPAIDIDIDGADEIDPHLNLIKGGGGALLREKVVASASKKMVVISDSSKLVPVLGKFPLPVEIIAFARAVVEKKIAGAWAARRNCARSPTAVLTLRTMAIRFSIAALERLRTRWRWRLH
jgi:ribose 5-phosphate isomerase A